LQIAESVRWAASEWSNCLLGRPETREYVTGDRLEEIGGGTRERAELQRLSE